ncbi:MAG TPA: ankyrin repeat domain-containing protein [Burkholderiales bacterium]|nr:ankyrin repeat domain-containing protein [Burkholderiales bacterium]
MHWIGVCRGAAVAVFALAAAATHAQAPAAPSLSPEELRAVYTELLETHDGFVYTINLLAYPNEEAARRSWEQMQQPRFRAQRFDKIFKNVAPRNVTLYAVDLPMREKLANLAEGERSGPVLTVRGWLIAEMLSMRLAAAPKLEEVQAAIPKFVAAGTLPTAAQLQSDPALRARSIANKVRTAEELGALPADFDVNMRLSSMHTLLIRAILADRLDVVEGLLRRGANPNLCAHRFCPLQLAVYRKSPAGVDALLKAGADPNQSDPSIGVPEGPLAAAAYTGDAALVERLIAAGAKVDGQRRGETPLMAAASAGNRAVAELLVAKGADVFAMLPGGPERTALDAAERAKRSEFAIWLRGLMREKAKESGQYAWEGWIEQDGRRAPIDGKPIALKRAPFRIVTRMKPERILYVSASDDARLLDEFAKGERVGGLFSNANVSFESKEGDDLVVHQAQNPGARWGGSQAWWKDDKDSRFSGVSDTPQGREHAREIRRLVVIDSADKVNDPVPVSAYKGGSIFLVVGTRVHMTLMDDEVFAARNVELKFQ